MEQNDNTRFCDYIRSKLPSWKGLSNDEIDFHLFSSLSNKVYKVTARREGCENNPLILRHFSSLEGIVDKAKELLVFDEMSKAGFGPKCFAHDGDIRLEQFIPSRCIQPTEYRERIMRRKLARTMAALHKLEVPGIDKEMLMKVLLDDKNYCQEFNDKCQKDIYSKKEKEIINHVKQAGTKEDQDFVRSVLPKEDIVFAHNDLLQGNILVDSENDKVIFIDYEYAAYNFRGFDIGNLFRESMFDYSLPEPPYFQVVKSNFPNDEELRDFLRYYIVFTDMKQDEQEIVAEDLINNDDLMNSHLETHYDRVDLKTREDELFRNAQIGVMVSFYYWAIWAVKMHKVLESDFDYLEFARAEFNGYQEWRKKLFDQTSPLC